MKIQPLLALTAGLLLLGLTSCQEDKAASAAVEQKTCPVSGEPLGSMGDPLVVTHGGVSVKLCCDSCTDKFHADPEKYIAKVKSETGQ
ncbi:MAG: hypothetical protein KDN18_13085 [Verrucomicrobiae bacterium]|nr:hypothetical protein [Verrucomicrobiae bacterium]